MTDWGEGRPLAFVREQGISGRLLAHVDLLKLQKDMSVSRDKQAEWE